jgi:stage V sporulation protein R
VVEGLKVERDYMRHYINPPEFLEEQRQKIIDEQNKLRRFPENPQKDILLFLLNYAPLERWQHAILEIIRDEAYYYAPQGMTKIMNEGWASYWHSKIMTEKAMNDSEVISFADHHAGVVSTSPGRLNPYKLGLELLRDIEERWNKGKFGKEYHECDDIQAKRNWDRQLGLGKQKLFEVRQLYNDVTFIDEFLTPEFIERQKLFSFDYNAQNNYYEIASREFKAIKERLLFQLTNFGQPYIVVEDGNYQNRGELYLKHRHEGIDLKLDYADQTMRNLHKIWTRPVHLQTIIGEELHLLSFDGGDFTKQKM